MHNPKLERLLTVPLSAQQRTLCRQYGTIQESTNKAVTGCSKLLFKLSGRNKTLLILLIKNNVILI